MLNGQELVDFVVDYGKGHGAKYTEARYIDATDESFVVRNGMFISVQEKQKIGMGIRVLVDGGMAFGSTDKMEKEPVQNLIDSLIKMAKAAKRKKPITLSEERMEKTTWKTPVKRAFKDVPISEKRQFLIDLDKRLKNEVGNQLKNRIGGFMLYTDIKYLANSDGARITSESSIPVFLYMNTAKGKLGTEQRFFSQAGSAGWEWFKEEKMDDVVVDDCQCLLKAANAAKPMRFDKPISVIISSEVAGIMAHENVGHPSEGDRILGREAAQAGESFYIDLLNEGKLGETVLGTEKVTIIDDPTVPGNAGFYLYDDEGVKARPRYLIKNGKLNELLLNREYAARFGTQSNSAARACAFDREPIVRMSNTYFAPGDYNSVDELAKEVSLGIYMKTFTEWNIDDRRFQSKYVGCEAYLIENGEITETMIRRPVLELTTKGILGNVEAVTKSLQSYYGICGKGDPMQGVHVAMGGVQLRLGNINVGGGI